MASGLRFGPVGPKAIHLCVDMQTLFAERTDWHVPWLERVLPTVTRLSEAGKSGGAASIRIDERAFLRVLGRLGPDALIISGGETDVCVLAAVMDAVDAGYRTVQALGYPGLADLKQALVASLEGDATSAGDMRRTLDDLGEDAILALDVVLATHEEALTTLRSAAFREQLGQALPVLHAAKRIAVFGIGPSAALARYVAVLLARGGRRSMCLDATGIMLADQMLDLRAGDAVLALAYGRAYREVVGLFREARRLQLPIILVSETANSAISKLTNVVLVIPRGKAQQVALHGGTLVGLEAIALALAAANREGAVATLERLNALRVWASGQRYDVG